MTSQAVVHNKFQNAKVYLIKCLLPGQNLIYIGSTTSNLKDRFNLHKSFSRKFPKIKLYEHMNKLGLENFEINLVSVVNCNSRAELLDREDHYIKLFNTVQNGLNSNYARMNAERKHATRKRCMQAWRLRNAEKYICEKCRFSSHIKTHFKNHIQTKKHAIIPQTGECYIYCENEEKEKKTVRASPDSNFCLACASTH